MTGTGTLARLILRRDRLILPLWGLLAAVCPSAIAGSTAELYPTTEARRSTAKAAMANPSPASPCAASSSMPSVGGLTAWTVGSSGAMLLGLVSMLLVIRHTRVDEESGRRELLGAGVVGRHAPLTAVLAVVFAANLLIAVLMSVMLMSGGLPAGGSVALGLSLAAAGWTFAAVGAVVAQVTESAVAARGMGVGVFVLFFLIRAVGDAGGADWLSWLSPLGWTLRVRPFAGERWWVLALLPALVALVAAVAYALSPAVTSPPACCRRGSGPPRRRPACVARWPWPGGCTAARSWRGPQASEWVVSRSVAPSPAAWTARSTPRRSWT